MKTYKIKQVDAFTDRTFTGNPAAVISEANGLNDEQMQAIAREMNLSETAFVFTNNSNDYDIEIRWKTPETEVDLCGHGTIAALHAVFEEKLYGVDPSKPLTALKVKTRSGILPVEIITETQKPMYSFGVPLPTFEEYTGQRFELFNALGISWDHLDTSLPIWLSDLHYVYIPFLTQESLMKMKPNFEDLKNLSHRSRIDGFCVFTTDTKHPTSAAHLRFFAPKLGINEDPVTGSAIGPLTCYLYRNKRLKGSGKICATIEQGYEIHRGGQVWTELDIDGENVVDIKISGCAKTVLNGEIYV